MPPLVCIDLGRIDYDAALSVQRDLRDRALRRDDEAANLLLLEHDPPVITLGRRGRAEHVLVCPDELAARGVRLIHAERGGDVTWHGPGQLVAYPIIRVDLQGRDVRQYVRALEGAVIRLLSRFGAQGRRVRGMTGIWAGEEKIAAIGVAVRRWVSYHGLAVNVSSDLSGFDMIVPCGLHGRGVTSLSRLLGREVAVSEVKPVLIECVVEEFGFDGWVMHPRPDTNASPGRG